MFLVLFSVKKKDFRNFALIVVFVPSIVTVSVFSLYLLNFISRDSVIFAAKFLSLILVILTVCLSALIFMMSCCIGFIDIEFQNAKILEDNKSFDINAIPELKFLDDSNFNSNELVVQNKEYIDESDINYFNLKIKRKM